MRIVLFAVKILTTEIDAPYHVFLSQLNRVSNVVKILESVANCNLYRTATATKNGISTEGFGANEQVDR